MISARSHLRIIAPIGFIGLAHRLERKPNPDVKSGPFGSLFCRQGLIYGLISLLLHLQKNSGVKALGNKLMPGRFAQAFKNEYKKHRHHRPR
jgi:hypothetical protein